MMNLENIADEVLSWVEGLALGTLLVVLTVLLFSMGCSAAQPEDNWCRTHRCEVAVVSFDPEPALASYTRIALDRVRAATGRDDLRIEPGGLPVKLHRNLTYTNELKGESPACAITTVQGFGVADKPQVIEMDPIAPNCRPFADQLVHEIIHALNPAAEHSDSGVFTPHIDSTVLDAGSLERLCEGFDCAIFVPEQ